MIIRPVEKYTLSQLNQWFAQAQKLSEPLIIRPCNPDAPKILQSDVIIRKHDDIAVLTQWLGGLKP